MKKQLLLASCLLQFTFVQGQTTWFNNDAVWHYSNGYMYKNGYNKLEYEKDSVHHGHNWRQFAHTFTGLDMYPSPVMINDEPLLHMFLRDTLGIQLCYTETTGPAGVFTDTIYDFSKTPGQSMYFEQAHSSYTLKRTITDTGRIDINGNMVRYQAITDSVFSGGINAGPAGIDTLVEYIGTLSDYIHPFYKYSNMLSTGNPNSGYFRCYSDADMGTYIRNVFASPTVTGCTWITGVDDEAATPVPIGVYPNPGSNHFTFTSALTGNTAVEIYSVYGQPVWKGNVQHGLTLDARSWQNGTYIARFTNGQTQWTQKLVKIN